MKLIECITYTLTLRPMSDSQGIVNGKLLMKKDIEISRRELRDQRIRAENIGKIMDGAEKVFAEKGYHGAKMSELAKASGLAKANLYYYVGSKEAIYINVIEELLARWDSALYLISKDQEPAEVISAYIRAKIQYSQEHPAASKIFAKEVISGSRFLTPAKKRAIHKITQEKADVINGWIKKGKMAPIDPYHFFFLLWGATQYYADFDAHIKNVLAIPRMSSSVYDTAIETITTVILRGCQIIE